MTNLNLLEYWHFIDRKMNYIKSNSNVENLFTNDVNIDLLNQDLLCDFLLKIINKYRTNIENSNLNFICNVNNIIDNDLRNFFSLIDEGNKKIKPRLVMALDPCYYVNKIANTIQANGFVETLQVPFGSDIFNKRIHAFIEGDNKGLLLSIDAKINENLLQEAIIKVFYISNSKKRKIHIVIKGIGYVSEKDNNSLNYYENLFKDNAAEKNKLNPEKWLKSALNEALQRAEFKEEILSNEDTFFIVCCKVPKFTPEKKLWLSSRYEKLGIKNPNVIYISAACASVGFAIKVAKDMLFLDNYKNSVIIAAEYPNEFEEISMKSLMALGNGEIKPFDKSRTGTALGYGGGVIILTKSINPAKNAIEITDVITKIGDPLSPRVDTALIQNILENISNISNTDLYIAHATGTKQGDEAEWNSINNSKFFKKNIPVWANKGYTKHLLYASGIPSICSAEFFLKGKDIPKIKGLKEFAFDCNDAFPVLKTTSLTINNVLLGMFGFSGCNAIVKLSVSGRS